MGQSFNNLDRCRSAAEGRTLARLTRRLAREVERLLRTYRQDIVEMQLLQERIAWCVTELYVMAAVLSKLDSMCRTTAMPLDGHAGTGIGDRTPACRRKGLLPPRGQAHPAPARPALRQ